MSPKSDQKVTVDVEGHHLQLTNLDKVLFPDVGFTKGQLIDYYTRVAPVLLPHLSGRPMTVKRYPNGVEDTFFFEKNASRGTPSWVRIARLPAPGSTKNRDEIDYVVVEELGTLVWLANLAAVELHVPQWHLPPRARKPRVDEIVFDLDPGPPADIEQCRRVALWLRDRLTADGLHPVAKTSGSKGMQMTAAVVAQDAEHCSRYAHALARELEAEHADLVVSRMTRSLREGKVLVDWSQNNGAKTTVAPYSVRARPAPTVSTPLTWEEVEGTDPLRFTTEQVLDRVARLGDLYFPAIDDDARAPLPSVPATGGR